MAWRPTRYLQEGELDNTEPNRVTGWMRFAGLKEKVLFDLEGNFHRDIRGATIYFTGDAYEGDFNEEAERYMDGFALQQSGKAGDITAGLAPQDFGSTPYIEIYSHQNGRVVIELEPVQLEVIGKPTPACESDPIDRKEQAKNMGGFLCDLASELGVPETRAVAMGETVAVERAKKIIVNDKIRGMKLLPKDIREILPAIGSQDGKGGRAIAYVKYLAPSANWTWYALSGEPVLDESSRQQDYRFFGLVFGQEKEFGCFLLSELEEVRGPMGLPIERDLHFQPTPLEEIAPEMFSKEQ